MACQRLVQSVSRCTFAGKARLLPTVSRVTLPQIQSQLQLSHDGRAQRRTFHNVQRLRAEPAATSTTTGAAITPNQPTPEAERDLDPNKHAAFLGEADSDDGFEAHRDAHGDPAPSLDASNAAFLGEADSDDGFEAGKDIDGHKVDAVDASNSAYLGEADSDDGHEVQKDIDGRKLEAIDASNSAYLGEGDSDDGFEAHREVHPEDGDHKITNPEESGLHGQIGEQDR